MRRLWSHVRQLHRWKNRRCGVPVGVGVYLVDNDVGVGNIVLIEEEAITEVFQLRCFQEPKLT